MEKQMIYIKTLQRILKLDLILEIMSQLDHYQKEEIKK